MTIEERLDRIEHVAADLAEERRKDREEYRQLWPDTRRQLNELTLKIADTDDVVARLGEKIDRPAEESRAADQRLSDRIDALVSAMGEFLKSRNGK